MTMENQMTMVAQDDNEQVGKRKKVGIVIALIVALNFIIAGIILAWRL